MKPTLHILCVGHEPDKLDEIAHGLSGFGHVVTILPRTSWVNLESSAEQYGADLLLLDVGSLVQPLLGQLGALHESHPMPILLFSRDGSRERMREALAAGVSAYVVDGFNASRLPALLELSYLRFEDMCRLRQRAEEAEAKLEARKLVEQAKRKLMQRHGMAEDAAYRRLRQEAMGQRLRIDEVARRMLDEGQ